MCGNGGGSRQEFMQNQRWADIFQRLDQDYVNRFQPREGQLLSAVRTESPEAAQLVKDTTGMVNNAFDSQRGAMQRDWRRFGINPTPVQVNAANRTLDMAREGMEVGLANSARQGIKDRNMGVMLGGISAVNRAVNRTGLGMPGAQ